MADADEKKPPFRSRLKELQQRLDALGMEAGRPLGPDKPRGPAGGKPPSKDPPATRANALSRLHESISRIEVELGTLEGAGSAPAEAPRRDPPAMKVPESADAGPVEHVREAAWSAAQEGELPPEVPDQGVGGRGIFGLLLAAVLFAAGFWTYRSSGAEFTLPSNHPSALAWQGDVLWVSDWFEPAVYRLEKTASGLKTVDRFPLEEVHAIALAVSKTHLYLADSWSRRIEKRRLDDALTLETSVPSPGGSPSALFFDGKQLWSADKDAHKVYRHSLDEGLEVERSYSIGHAPTGLYADEERFWSSSAERNELYKHDINTGSVLGAYDLSEFAAEDAPLAGFTWRGGELWFSFDGSDALIERPWWRLDRKAGELK